MRRLLLIAIAIVLVALLPTRAAIAEDGNKCGVSAAWGFCSNGESVVIKNTQTKPGNRGGDTNVNPVVGRDNYTPPPPPPSPFENCLDVWERNKSCFVPLEKTEPGEDTPAPVEIPPITITDLASFAPQGSALAAEPDNLGVAGLPANFVATADTHTQTGTLFGFPISVRFTPASFTFHYGDGQTLTHPTGGRSWDALELPQFSPTDTSHTYTERGTYTARADVAYTAEIDLGGGWFPLSGQLTTTGPTQDIRIYEAHTALVAHTCTENPHGPGC